MESLKGIWDELILRYTSNTKLIEEAWTEIKTNYSGKKRYYHNLTHIKYILGHAIQYQKQINDFDTLLFSIFYHDLIYRVSRKDNEYKSAQVARNRLIQFGATNVKAIQCQDQIRATKDHKKSLDDDTNYLLDFDLAILGDHPEQYQAYTQNIRKEYSLYPRFLYNKGRKKVLQHFLAMDRIFKTEAFHEKYGEQARENMTWELEKLTDT